MSAWLAVVLLLKATVVLLLALAWTLVLPVRAHSLRHAVWTTSLLALLLLPALGALPGVSLPVPPQWVAAFQPASADTRTPPDGSTSSGLAVPGEPAATLPAATSGFDATSRSGTAPGVGASRTNARSPILFQLWAAGSAAVLLWLLAGRISLHLLRRRATLLESPAWSQPLRDAAWLLDVPQVAVYRSTAVAVPMTYGALRPVIMVPAESDSWTEDRRRVVLLHELAHVRRRDGLTQLMAAFACALWWFHPLAWVAARRMRVEREHACDALVVGAGAAPSEYANHLLELARQCGDRRSGPALALPMARPGHLEGRLLGVLADPSSTHPHRMHSSVPVAVLLLLTVAIAALEPVAASETESQQDASAAGTGPYARDAATDAPGTAAATVENSVLASDTSAPAGAAAGVAATSRTADVVVTTTVSAPPPAPVTADTPRRSQGTVRLDDQDSIARIVPRVPLRSASFAITSTDGRTALLLQDTTILLQLTDRGLKEIGPQPAGEDRSFLAQVLTNMLRGGLRVLLDRGIEYSLRDLQQARYADGRLVLESVRGGRIFDDVVIDGEHLMASFSERDARAFAARANSARARLRR